MSELREDIVSGDWVIIAPGRAKRPEDLLRRRAPRITAPKNTCPFEDLERSGNWPPIALYPASGKKWSIAVVPNKFPALSHVGGQALDTVDGVYHAKTGVGDHEVIITRDHWKNFAALAPQAAKALFAVLQARHQAIANDAGNAYVATFFNWGPTAGASLSHPHYQILALPIVPPRVLRSLNGAMGYFKKHRRCVRCDIIAAERKKKVRVVAENRHAIAIAPYASKRPFEVSILPKKHEPSFAGTPKAVLDDVVLLLQKVMQRVKKQLHDPDLNFFIHDAPTDGSSYPHHHWHVEVVPVAATLGGFEVSTVVNINVIDPSAAAASLRGVRRAR